MDLKKTFPGSIQESKFKKKYFFSEVTQDLKFLKKYFLKETQNIGIFFFF